MKKFILILLVLMGVGAPSLAYGDDYPNILGIGGDKYLHFGVSAGLTLGMYTVFSNMTGREVEGRLPILIASTSFAFALGLAKEVMDAGDMPKGQRYLDGGDLAADALGCGVTAIAIYLLDIHGKKDSNINLRPSGRGIALSYRW